MVKAKCIACNHDVTLGPKPRKWTFVTCQHCGIRLEIIQVNPPMLDWPLSEVEEIKDETYNPYHKTIG